MLLPFHLPAGAIALNDHRNHKIIWCFFHVPFVIKEIYPGPSNTGEAMHLTSEV
jgi:hypothetical protein